MWMFLELLHKFTLGKTIHAYYMYINFCLFQNLYRCVTVAGTRMICPRRSRGGARRDILHTRSLSRPSSGNWRWAFYCFSPQTESFHLRQKVFTSDEKFSRQTTKFPPQIYVQGVFSAGSPFSILKWKKAYQPSNGSRRWNIFWNTSSGWLKLSFHFVTESGEGQ